MTNDPDRRHFLMLAAGAPLAACGDREQERGARMTETQAVFSESFLFSHEKISHPVYTAGDGPGVLLMHELPGMTPEFWRFADWLVDAGFTVYAPDLYADQEGPVTRPSLAGNSVRACISREIHLFARNASSPLTVWLRALAAKLHETVGGPGVGAVGMCMTGNFALSLVLDAPVIAPVASQPAMPVNYWTARSKPALHMSEEEMAALAGATDVDVMALRFKGDPTCTKARFDAIEALIGKDRFHRIELEDEDQNPDGNPYPHAVLTKDLIDEEGSATRKARDQVITFLQARLQGEAGR